MRAVKKAYNVLNALSGGIQKVLEGVVAFLIVTCALDLFFQVIYRFIIIKFTSFSFCKIFKNVSFDSDLKMPIASTV